jgi:DNA modification methylase
VNDPTLLIGDCRETLRTLPDASVNCCVTSPPYFGLRDYGHEGQIGLEQTPDDYVAEMVAVFREVRRVLREDGTLWLNLGDSYCGYKGENYCKNPKTSKLQSNNHIPVANSLGTPQTSGLKPKDIIGIPWRVAFALQADGWYLRQDIIWHKPNPMPESVTDRCTKAHEYIFLLTKSAKYYYDADAIKEPVKADWGTRDREGGKYHEEGTGLQPHTGLEKSYATANKRSVWTVCTRPYKEAHFATFPPKLIEPCIMAGCSSKVCAKCGAPWERVVESTKTFESGSGRSGNPINGKQDLTASSTNSTPDIRKGPVVHTRTIGWEPTCACNADYKAGTVLDPFNGAGTTGLVAIQQGRQYIGCELNPEYAALSWERWKPELAQGRFDL